MNEYITEWNKHVMDRCHDIREQDTDGESICDYCENNFSELFTDCFQYQHKPMILTRDII